MVQAPFQMSKQKTRDPAIKQRFQVQSFYVQQPFQDVNSDWWDSYLKSLEVNHPSDLNESEDITEKVLKQSRLENNKQYYQIWKTKNSNALVTDKNVYYMQHLLLS